MTRATRPRERPSVKQFLVAQRIRFEGVCFGALRELAVDRARGLLDRDFGIATDGVKVRRSVIALGQPWAAAGVAARWAPHASDSCPVGLVLVQPHLLKPHPSATDKGRGLSLVDCLRSAAALAGQGRAIYRPRVARTLGVSNISA